MGKILNKIAYSFFPQRLLDLLGPPEFPALFQACAYTANAISFVLTNQKTYYNRKHQTLFLNIGDWAMLRLYKSYFIPSSLGVIKRFI